MEADARPDTVTDVATLSDLGDPRYIALRTFRKSGVPVETPVWAATVDGRLTVWTGPEAGKVKRIRNNPIVEVCASDSRGRPKGPWLPGEARLAATAEDVAAGIARMRRKYGWQFRIAQLFSRSSPAIIEIVDRA